GKIVRPIEATGDDHVLRPGAAHGVQQRLHAGGIIGGLLAVAPVLFGDLAAVAPDVPGHVVRLVVEVEEDGGMVFVGLGDVLPERQAVLVGHDVLGDLLAPHACVRPVQVQYNVTAPRGAGIHDLLDESAVGFAV